MRVAVSGSRSITDAKAVDGILSQYFGFKDVMVVGDCKTGVDPLAKDYGVRFFCDVEVHAADWNKHGKAAGPIRNDEMLADADVLVAIWDGNSRGTHSAIRAARRHRVETHIYYLAAHK